MEHKKCQLSVLVTRPMKEELEAVYKRGNYNSFSVFIEDILNMGLVEYRSDE